MNPANSAPSVPTLTAEPDGATGLVTLQWGASTDDLTPAARIIYQIRVATCSGCNNIASGRFAPPYANAGATTSYKINLPNAGTYYWSVTAIDNTGFASSAWATEDSFFLGTTPFTLQWSDGTKNVGGAGAWADYDKDGDLDFLVPTGAKPNRVMRNDSGSCTFTEIWTSTEQDNSIEAAWGDLYGDGELDQVIANSSAVSGNRIYNPLAGYINFNLNWTSAELDSSNAVSLGDYDNDGDLDQLIGNNGVNRVYRHDGGTAYTVVWSSTEADDTRSIAWGDYDKDGDLDQLVGNYSATYGNRLYRNDGGNTFNLVWTSTEKDNTRAVAWGDYDGDGDLDQLVGNSLQPNQVYRNDNGTFALAWSSTESDDTYDVAWGDYDGDGDLDQSGVNYGQVNRVYQKGAGDTWSVVWSSTESDQSRGTAWGDYDGDRDLDILSISTGAGQGGNNRVYKNLVSPSNFPPSVPALTAEPDAFTGWVTLNWSASTDDNTPAPALTYHLRVGTCPGCGNVKSGTFTPPAGNAGATTTFNIFLATATTYYWSVAAVDNTGFAMSAWAAEDSFVLTALFESVWTSPETDSSTDAAWGDYDGDGDLDQLIGNEGAARRVYRNDGGAAFSLVWSSTMTTDWVESVEFGDPDRDGDLDILQGANGDQNRLFQKDSGDTFNLVWSDSDLEPTMESAWGDYDNDGDVDVLAGNGGGVNAANRMYRNNGDNTFTSVWTSAEAENTDAVAWADFDRDGYLDHAAGNRDQVNRVYRNNGNGTFTSAWATTETDRTTAVAWGDSDGDGDPDLLVGNTGVSGGPNRLYRNNGDGTFTLVWTSTESDLTNSVAWGDYDGDGDLDQLVGNGGASANRVYRNDGSNTFSLIWNSLESENTYGVAWGDYDGDGDLDQIAANYSAAANRVYRNNMNFSNTAPSAPALSAEPDAGIAGATTTVKLQWSASTDDRTPAALITYQIRVATCSGCQNIVSAKFAPPGGNAGATTSFFITLATGTYYWSVSAVDSSFATSAWSAEDSFVIFNGQANASADPVAPTSAAAGQANILILKIRITDAAGGNPGQTINSVKVASLNTLDTDVSNLALWEDLDDDGLFEPLTDDAPLVATLTFQAASATFGGLGIAVPDTGDQVLFVSYDMATSPVVDNDTLDASVPANGVTLAGPIDIPASAINSAGTSDIEIMATALSITPASSTRYLTSDCNACSILNVTDSSIFTIGENVTVGDDAGDEAATVSATTTTTVTLTAPVAGNYTVANNGYVVNVIANVRMLRISAEDGYGNRDLDSSDLVTVSSDDSTVIVLSTTLAGGGTGTDSTTGTLTNGYAQVTFNHNFCLPFTSAVTSTSSLVDDIATIDFQGDITLDTTNPASGTIVITDVGGYTGDTTPTLTLSSTDDCSGLGQMRFACTSGDIPSGVWVAYAATYSSFDMTSGPGCVAGDGSKTIFVQYKDLAGYPSSLPYATDSTFLDSGPPTFAGLESATDTWLGTSVSLNWSPAVDPATPITYLIYLSTTSGNQNFVAPPYATFSATPALVTGLATDQIYYFVVRARAAASNTETNVIEFATTPTCKTALSLTKAVNSIDDPLGGNNPIPGALIEFKLDYANSPSYCFASDPQIVDYIPANSAYYAGSILLNDIGKTDAPDVDECEYAVAPDRVICDPPNIPPGDTGSMKFKITID